MVKVISNNFLSKNLIEQIISHPDKQCNCAPDYRESADANWLIYFEPWLQFIDKCLEYRSQIEKDYDCDSSKLVDVWARKNKDIWNLDDHTKFTRENADIHKDFFEGFSKVINLQLYVSENIPPEAGTCFWEHTGTDLLSDTMSNKGAVATWPYVNWKLIEQIPFEPNVAFTYNAGPDGMFHSAPTTEMLIESQVPSHVREVIIIRFRYK